jgi:DNA-directed RNA polymerase specialized sigma24 family protein
MQRGARTGQTGGVVTGLPHSWREGNRSSPAALTPVVYAELRRMAHGYMRRRRPRRHNLKRGTGVPHLSLEEAATLDGAMNALGQFDPRKVPVVEMHFFGGLNVEETAEVLNLPPVTVRRDGSGAKAWSIAK